MCLDNLVRAVTDSRPVYQLYDEDIKNHCEADKRFTTIDSVGEKTLFDLNNVPYGVLPAFDVSDNYKYTRFTRNLIELKPECLHNVDEFIQFERKIVDYLRRMKILKILAIIALVVTCLLGFGQFIVTMVSVKSSDDSIPIVLSLVTPRHFFTLFMFFFLLLTSISAKFHFNFYESEAWGTCSDEFTNQKTRELSESLERYMTTWNFRIALFLLFILVIELIFENFRGNFGDRWTGYGRYRRERNNRRVFVEMELLAGD